MDVISLKKYIFEEKKIEYILEQIGCHSIKFNENKGYYSASQPDGDNLQGVNIRNNEYLSYRSFSRNVSYDDGKDLISLVEEVKNISFIEAVKYLHSLLGLEFTYKKTPEKKEKKIDPLGVFKRIKERNRRGAVNVNDIHALDDKLIDDYVPLLHIDWVKNDGITNRARDKFGICYSYKQKRIIIPIRYALTGELLAFNCRTTVEHYAEFGIKKYLLTSGYNKSNNVFGMWENREEIEEKKVAIVYESEKSVLKRYSRMDGTGLAIQGKIMSEEQCRLILGLNVLEIVICLDNDIPIEEIYSICEKFYRKRKVSFIYDKWDLLKPKSCAADADMKVFDFLFKHRVIYDEKCHQEYLSMLKKGR